MKRNILLAALPALLMVLWVPCTTQAQTYGGAVLDRDMMMPTEFAALSQTRLFGTARSMAMGGAFASLGGDVSSISINPAGLGMFTQEVLSLTPMISSANASTTAMPSWGSKGNNKTSFGFANIGATFKFVENSSGSLIALNGAVSYNRLADFNSRLSFSSDAQYNGSLVPSIVDIFAMQLEDAALYPASNGDFDFADNPYYWPAQTAYNTFLLDPLTDNAGWATNVIGQNASVRSSYSMVQRGRADEYNFAVGGNVGNFLYFGATLGLQEIVQHTDYTYQEEYLYEGGYAYAPAGVDPIDYQADYSSLLQSTYLTGSGVNLKVGVTARPTRALRVGVAFHTPTCYSLARSYQTEMETLILGNYDDLIPRERFDSYSPEIVDNYEYSWDFRTPAKLIAGASLQVGSFGVVTFDYERQWYNWIRVSNAPGDLAPAEYTSIFEDAYKPTNTFRFGIEAKPIPAIALRAGGGVSSSMLKDESLFYNSPTATSSHYITCGAGFQIGRNVMLDLAYQLYCQDYSPYYLFYNQDTAGEIYGSSRLFESSYNFNYFSATLSFKL